MWFLTLSIILTGFGGLVLHMANPSRHNLVPVSSGAKRS